MTVSHSVLDRATDVDTSCRSCGTLGMRIFSRSTGVPVNNARVFERREDALAVPLGTVELGYCERCGFIENVAYDRSLVTYDQTYEEQQSFSPTFTAFADDLARDLVERWDLHHKRIVEIGCGKGDFLAKLCELGPNEGIGIDPSAVPERLRAPGSERVTIRPEFYSSRCAALDADAIVCRHTLEHVPDVAQLVRMVARSLHGDPGKRVFFEVPDVLRVLRERAFWDVYYEHCSYFTAGSLARLFRCEGFAVDAVRLGFNGQYVLLEAREGDGRRPHQKHRAEEDSATLASAVALYEATVSRSMRAWREKILAIAGGEVAIWGSGSKCVAFLSELGVPGAIGSVVDINPYRQGRYLPGSGVRVDPPSSLAATRPALVIAMNAAYTGEITDELRGLGVDALVEAL